MTPQTPSAGAISAASAICDSGMDTAATRLMAAQIIDREAVKPAVAKLVELVQLLLKTQQSCEQCGEDFFRKGEDARKIARALIAKHRGAS